jgi:hypothetical protein
VPGGQMASKLGMLTVLTATSVSSSAIDPPNRFRNRVGSTLPARS